MCRQQIFSSLITALLAKWRHTLNEAKRLAVKAVDEYNCSTGHYADFIGTMVRAWLYMLQAEFQRYKIDYRYKGQDGNPILIEGEPKALGCPQVGQRALPGHQ